MECACDVFRAWRCDFSSDVQFKKIRGSCLVRRNDSRRAFHKLYERVAWHWCDRTFLCGASFVTAKPTFTDFCNCLVSAFILGTLYSTWRRARPVFCK